LTYISSYAFGLPHSEQNFPVFTAPQLQVHGASGAGFPHSVQNLPLFTAPQLQVHVVGIGLPHSEQNFPVFTAPQLQVQPLEAVFCCAACAC